MLSDTVQVRATDLNFDMAADYDQSRGKRQEGIRRNPD